MEIALKGRKRYTQRSVLTVRIAKWHLSSGRHAPEVGQLYEKEK